MYYFVHISKTVFISIWVSTYCEYAESLGFALFVMSRGGLLMRMMKLRTGEHSSSLRFVNRLTLKKLKVLRKLFQELAVSKGRAFGGY